MRRILIHMDPERDREQQELLAAADALFPDAGRQLHVLLIHGTCDALKGKVDAILDVRDHHIDGSDARQMCGVMAALHQTHAYDAILMADDLLGRDCAPRLAVRIEAAIVTSVSAIGNEQGRARIERPTHDGQAIGRFEADPARPLILTIQPRRFVPIEQAERPTTILHPQFPNRAASDIRRIARQEIDRPDILDSDILISGGRGVARDFAALQPLADALGGAVSASRAMVDAGFADRSQQVGQSGKRVSPRLYLALGINGAIQHVLGLADAEHIISVNTNVDAPICSLSDIVVKGDALTFADKLLNKIKEEQSNGTL